MLNKKLFKTLALCAMLFLGFGTVMAQTSITVTPVTARAHDGIYVLQFSEWNGGLTNDLYDLIVNENPFVKSIVLDEGTQSIEFESTNEEVSESDVTVWFETYLNEKKVARMGESTNDDVY